MWSGALSLRWAVLSGVVIEALLWVTAGTRLIIAARSFRSSRSAGRDLWSAVEDGFAQVVPRKMARFIVLEPRLWLALARLCARRNRAGGSRAFAYHRGLRTLFWALFVYTGAELVVVEIVLALALRSRLWLWVSLGVHGYALIWLLGLWASFVTRPHRADDDALRIRDGVFSEVLIPYQAITGVRAATAAAGLGGRTGLKVDAERGTAWLAVGPQTTVTLALDPGVPIETTDGDELHLSDFSLTVDDPHGFVDAVRARIVLSPHDPGLSRE